MRLTDNEILARAREELSYEPDTGLFRWRVTRGRARIGSVAGQTDRHGHVIIGIGCRRVAAHRLALALRDGRFPDRPMDVDHINGIPGDNRLSNLRVCTHQQNLANSGSRGGSSRFKGVVFFKRDRNWMARITVNGRGIYLGYFDDEAAAARAYDAAARKHFGRHARLNFPD